MLARASVRSIPGRLVEVHTNAPLATEASPPTSPLLNENHFPPGFGEKIGCTGPDDPPTDNHDLSFLWNHPCPLTDPRSLPKPTPPPSEAAPEAEPSKASEMAFPTPCRSSAVTGSPTARRFSPDTTPSQLASAASHP